MNFLSSKLYYQSRSNNKLHIKNILNDYWDSFLKLFPLLHIRDVVHSEVKKVRLCHTIALGYTRFECPNCNNYSIVPHTYGRDLKWNPHIHVLITEGGLTNKTMKFKPYSHFNYLSLRKTFQKILLDKLYKIIGSSFYFLKCKLYKEKKNGFYVYAHPRQFSDIQKGTEYIMHYSGKPAMAESRIVDIHYDTDMITYGYDDHKTDTRVIITEHIFEFIAKIIRHIPDKHFKTIRYYGIYSLKNHRYTDFFVKLHKYEEINKLKKRNTWRYNLIDHFQYDPILCECGHIMKKVYMYIPMNESEDKWYEIKFGPPVPFKKANWQHFTKYCPTKY